jgi:arginyl-tRNA synthetase
MSGLLGTVTAHLRGAFEALAPDADPMLRRSDRADLQVNGVLPLAKRLGVPPRALAEDLVGKAGLSSVCERVEVAGPGFINLTLSPAFLVAALAQMAADDRLGVDKAGRPLNVVVDYGGPNVAKEMHVGHLRSAIIGDALVRLLDHLGHRVIKENHIGDWGTPFGMLIEHLLDVGETTGSEELAVGDLNVFYQQARLAFDSDPSFAERSRRRVVELQSGDPETLRLWRVLVDQSVRYFSDVFARLGVLLGPEDVMGESAYNDMLPAVISDLEEAGLLRESDGARCVFPAGFSNREGEPLPLIVQKSDGGYNYAASDLAAIRDRVTRLEADLLLYVVGLPQAQHLDMVFAAARMAGWLPAEAQAVHVGFGSVLSGDGRMFRSREGSAVRLVELIDEAVNRAAAAVASKNPGLEEAERRRVASAVGVGALKYADLSTDRTRDYRFDWDRMLAFEGNTAGYLQYAHARICSILRRPEALTVGKPYVVGSLAEPAERELAKALLGFADSVEASVEAWAPHKLCTYLFELAGTFTAFYEHCPVLRAPDPLAQESRLALCELTGRVLREGLALLGIEAPTTM